MLENSIFMQDGASPNIVRRVKYVLRTSFGKDCVLIRHFPHAWPPKSPDCRPFDFWLWSSMKSQVYCDRPTTIGRLKYSIQCIFLTKITDMLFFYYSYCRGMTVHMLRMCSEEHHPCFVILVMLIIAFLITCYATCW